MMRKKCCLIGVTALLILGIAGMFTGRAEASETAVKKTIHNSPYVLFSPDGQAFTTCAGDRNYKWYEDNDSTTIDTGIKSSLRPLQTGEHYYNRYRRGELAVGMWKVVHRRGHCIIYHGTGNGMVCLPVERRACVIITPAGKHFVRIVGRLWNRQIFI